MRILALVLGIVILVAAATRLKLRGPDIPYSDLEAKYASDASRFVDLPGGLHVHYRDEGKPNGPLLLLLHGFGDSYTSWEGWVGELKPRFHIISLDFPGHGLTRAPQDFQLSGAGLADFVDAFATKLALPKFAVAGNSMGGGVAWQLAVRHPERLDALILVDAADFPNEKPPAEVPLAFKILQYPLGRVILRNIDNRPLIAEGLKTDVYDKSLITQAVVNRWAEFQRARTPCHLDGRQFRCACGSFRRCARRHQSADLGAARRERCADRTRERPQVCCGDTGRKAHPLRPSGTLAADRDSAALRS